MNLVNGTSTNDILSGTPGSDWIRSYEGEDTVYGGLGRDIYTPGGDDSQKSFLDFEDGVDLIDLSEWGVHNFNQLVVEDVEGGGYLVRTHDHGHHLFIMQMDNDDFVGIDSSDLFSLESRSMFIPRVLIQSKFSRMNRRFILAMAARTG